MRNKNVLLIAMVMSSLKPASGVAAMVRVYTGQSISLPCCPKLDADVDWVYRVETTSHPDYVYSNHVIYKTYRSRFAVDSNVDGCYNLTVSNAQLSDSGYYACIEDSGFGEKHNVSVSVIEIDNEVACCVGQLVNLTCPKIYTNVDWQYRTELGGSPEPVPGDAHPQPRITLELNSSSSFNLVISQAESQDAGFYSCIQNGGAGYKYITRLLVSDNPDDCNVEATEDIWLSEDDTKLKTQRLIFGLVLGLLLVAIVVGGILLFSCYRRLRSLKSKLKGEANIEREVMLSAGDVVGETDETNETTQAPAGYKPQLSRTLQRQGQANICGVAQLGRNTYVAYFGCNSIQVFGSDDQQLDDITVQDLKDPRDIVACRGNCQLYVADWANSCVWLVKEDSRASILVSSITPRSLSVKACRLLVTFDNNRLLLLEADGARLEEISLPSDMNPRHAVQSKNNTFIVCHTGRHSDDRKHHKVSEVNDKGQVIRSCSEELSAPHHLALDGVGRVLVADQYNHRVLLLNKFLRFEQVLLNKQNNQLNSPYRLSYDELTDCLLIGELDRRLVKVYSLKKPDT